MDPPHDRVSDFLREKGKFWLVTGGILLLIIASIAWWRFHIYPYASTDDANIDGVEISVSPETGGRIAQLLVDEGDAVKAGDPLFILEDMILQAQKEKARASIANAGDQVNLQRIKMELSWQDFQRAKKEFESGVISSEAMDHAQKGLEAARAELQATYSFMAIQSAQLRLIETQLSKCTVVAPCDGVIAKRWHFPGDVVREGQAVFSLFDLAQIWVTANLEETKLGSVRLGNAVYMTVDAYPKQSFEGSVAVIGAGAASQFSLIPPNNTSGNFTKVTQRVPIRISFATTAEEKNLYLRPGMSVEIKIKVH
jgi:membrane fusion protein (multidrug efflux system)